MRVAIITTGYLPVPATKGGAVESIIDDFIKQNEKEKKVEFEVFSIYEKESYEIGKRLNKTNIVSIKVNSFIKGFDYIIYFIAKNILKKENTMSYRYILQRIFFLNKVSKILKKDNFDKILLENNHTLYLALKWRKNYIKYKDRYYLHVHNEVKPTYGCEEIIRNTKKIICVSDYIRREYIEKLNIDKEKIGVLINCIDTEIFNGKISDEKKFSIKKKYKIDDNCKVILFTGRITREKGIKELLLALSKVKFKNYKLLVVGDFFFGTKTKNKFNIELQNIIKDIKDKVIFTGYVTHNEIPQIYAIADIVVLPSICEDAAPLTIIESMASGLPIITTNSGGIPEYAQNGCAIILDKEKDLQSQLSKSIDYLLENEEERKKMRKISKENATKLNLNNFYKNLLIQLK